MKQGDLNTRVARLERMIEERDAVKTYGIREDVVTRERAVEVTFRPGRMFGWYSVVTGEMWLDAELQWQYGKTHDRRGEFPTLKLARLAYAAAGLPRETQEEV